MLQAGLFLPVTALYGGGKDMNEPRYTVGQKFKTRAKHPQICTVVEIFRTYNSKNELVKVNYQAEYELMGQMIKIYDLPEATIARGKIDNK
jgi:hypothetical protein